MTVANSAKVSALYPRVVISLLAKRLEKPPFCHSSHFLWCMAQRSLHASTKVYYGSYAKLCQGSTQYPSIAKVSRGSRGTMTPLAPCESGRVTTPNSHSSKQGTLPTASLIIKQVVSYQTRGGTCCHRVSTPMTRSLADSNMTNHITRRIPTISTIPNLAQTTASNLTTVTSYHDRWKTNTLNTQHKLNSTL
jgi:hypothetical protein